MAAVGLTPQALTQAVREGDATTLEAMRGPMGQWIERSRVDLSRGLSYTLAVRPWRLRWACALPALIGLRTLQAIEETGPRALTQTVKVSRPWVYGLMLRLLFGGLRASRLKSLALSLGARPLPSWEGKDNGTMSP